jgi:hypothetical protein
VSRPAPTETGRWKLTLVTIQGQSKFIRLPVYTDDLAPRREADLRGDAAVVAV